MLNLKGREEEEGKREGEKDKEVQEGRVGETCMTLQLLMIQFMTNRLFTQMKLL